MLAAPTQWVLIMVCFLVVHNQQFWADSRCPGPEFQGPRSRQPLGGWYKLLAENAGLVCHDANLHGSISSTALFRTYLNLPQISEKAVGVIIAATNGKWGNMVVQNLAWLALSTHKLRSIMIELVFTFAMEKQSGMNTAPQMCILMKHLNPPSPYIFVCESNRNRILSHWWVSLNWVHLIQNYYCTEWRLLIHSCHDAPCAKSVKSNIVVANEEMMREVCGK
jgi:hypothetical protein